ncbi:hypothetical protein IEQ34_008287 [Dendrobium chrysotoxum]|uniref:Uncharacterized protein n=1 Tax=Dendrobium chrysotoxum TaxID=161865 RepID=A0AAV7H6P3_DENCH|nr:hypothetical protein IEQ34_008287 [Dendrobium chrysotoxum]
MGDQLRQSFNMREDKAIEKACGVLNRLTHRFSVDTDDFSEIEYMEVFLFFANKEIETERNFKRSLNPFTRAYVQKDTSPPAGRVQIIRQMLSSKRIMEMAKKCRKVASFGRRSVLSTTNDREIASRGHIFVYSVDGQRFMIPLTYLRESIFRELFRMSEDEFGLQSDGPIMLPCDAPTMEYILSLFSRRN